MKNLLLAPLAFMLASGLQAQTPVFGDTIGITTGSTPLFSPNNQVSRPAYAGGFAFGVNNDPNNNFTGLAQAYVLPNEGNIVALLALFAGKTKGPNNVPNTKMTFRLHPLVNNAAFRVVINPLTGQPDLVPVVGPGPILASADYFFDEADTTLGTLNFIPLAAPTAVSGQGIAVSIDFKDLKQAGDIIGILSDAPGNGLGMEYTFHYIDQGGSDQFYVTSNSIFQGALNVNIGLFAVKEGVEDTIPNPPTSLANIAFERGLKVNAYPNPANTTLEFAFEVQDAMPVEISLLDMNGKLVLQKQLGTLPSGMHFQTLDVSGLAAGKYIYAIGSGFNRIARTVVVAH